MEEYQVRVFKEREFTEVKITNLKTFIASERFKSVEKAEQDRLKKQLDIMQQYSAILNERVVAIMDKDKAPDPPPVQDKVTPETESRVKNFPAGPMTDKEEKKD